MKRILCVDDTPDIRGLVRAILRGEGLDVVVAGGGAQALEEARAEVPDAVLLDLDMPGMSGLETLRHMRAESRLAAIPVAIMTAYRGTADTRAAVSSGATCILAKPFDPEDLRSCVRSLVGCPAAPHAEFASRHVVDVLWHGFAGSARERVAVLEAAAEALREGCLDEATRFAAAREAHRLAGALGTFGAVDGTRLARDLECALRGDDPAATTLSELVQRVLRAVEAHGQALARRQPEAASMTRPTVLILDEDPLQVGLLRALLEPRGVRVATLDDGDAPALAEQITRRLRSRQEATV